MTTGNQLFCRLDGLNPEEREKQRHAVLTRLQVQNSQSVPLFDEAVQTAIRLLKTPIAWLGFMIEGEYHIKSSVGLSHLGLMNQLALQRRIPSTEVFCSYSIDSGKSLRISEISQDPLLSKSTLFQHYHIHAYLGVPLITREGVCIGTLAVMDNHSHDFTEQDEVILELIARCCWHEYEQYQPIITPQGERTTLPITRANPQQVNPLSDTNEIKIKLLGQLTQDLRTPLTSIIGMASVLSQEIYGPLTHKQKEYLDIIYNSGQHLVALSEELVHLNINQESNQLNLASVDVEMLCQQVINHLDPIAKQQQQDIRLSVEPGYRIWNLDKEKVRQSLYYLIMSILELAESGGQIRLHVSRKEEQLQLATWFSYPWLGDGVSQIEALDPLIQLMITDSVTYSGKKNELEEGTSSSMNDINIYPLSSHRLAQLWQNKNQGTERLTGKLSRELLDLILSCHLAELHQGYISLQGLPTMGYRYVLKLPQW